MKTEAEAWNYIAELFDMPEHDYTTRGLCLACSLLEANGIISYPTYEAMYTRVKDYSARNGILTVYIWPHHETLGDEFRNINRDKRAALARQFAIDATKENEHEKA